MNNKRPLYEMINSLQPEEYADFCDCVKELFGDVAGYPSRYKMVKSLLMDPENETSFNILTKGCQIAIMLFVSFQDRQTQLQEQIDKALRYFD